MITVVIPYFQRSSGVLRKSLASIAAQQDCPLPIKVIVVDDASPVPAEGEIAATPLPANVSIQIIKQPNGGPGAARNAGLNAMPESTRYVAFLDSDDAWTPNHLARATEALSLGYDFYFADLFQLDQTVGAFARAGRIQPAEHPSISTRCPNLHAYSGDFFDQVLRGNVVGTPTVVYDWHKLRAERFRTEYTTAGEDYLFWMAVGKLGARIAFSAQVEAICGKGVNVYSGSGWGTDTHLLRTHQEIRFRLATSKAFTLDGVQRDHIRRELKRLRFAFAQDVLHRMHHLKGFPKGLLLKHARLDPLSIVGVPWSLIRIMTRR